MVLSLQKSCEWPPYYCLLAVLGWGSPPLSCIQCSYLLGTCYFWLKAGSVFGLNIYEMLSLVNKMYFVFNEQMTQNCLRLLKDKLLCATMEHGQRQ